MLALKFLLAAQAGDTSARKKLLNEAQAAARLDHPFVCKVYEVSENAERPFIAMEYVDGTTLSGLLRQGPLPIKQAVRLAIEIAEAVDFAHKRGIIHRDLKPSNVMIAADGHVKVMDFGVAKYIELGADDATVTMTATRRDLGDDGVHVARAAARAAGRCAIGCVRLWPSAVRDDQRRRIRSCGRRRFRRWMPF